MVFLLKQGPVRTKAVRVENLAANDGYGLHRAESWPLQQKNSGERVDKGSQFTLRERTTTFHYCRRSAFLSARLASLPI